MIVTIALIFLKGAIAVALPVIIAIDLSAGAVDLTRKDALVTRLNSLEDAASMKILCLDKTGTITQNTLSVVDVKPFRSVPSLHVNARLVASKWLSTSMKLKKTEKGQRNTP